MTDTDTDTDNEQRAESREQRAESREQRAERLGRYDAMRRRGWGDGAVEKNSAAASLLRWWSRGGSIPTSGFFYFHLSSSAFAIAFPFPLTVLFFVFSHCSCFSFFVPCAVCPCLLSLSSVLVFCPCLLSLSSVQ